MASQTMAGGKGGQRRDQRVRVLVSYDRGGCPTSLVLCCPLLVWSMNSKVSQRVRPLFLSEMILKHISSVSHSGILEEKLLKQLSGYQTSCSSQVVWERSTSFPQSPAAFRFRLPYLNEVPESFSSDPALTSLKTALKTFLFKIWDDLFV